MYSRLITPARIHSWGDEELLEATEQDRARIVQAAPCLLYTSDAADERVRV